MLPLRFICWVRTDYLLSYMISKGLIGLNFSYSVDLRQSNRTSLPELIHKSTCEIGLLIGKLKISIPRIHKYVLATCDVFIVRRHQFLLISYLSCRYHFCWLINLNIVLALAYAVLKFFFDFLLTVNWLLHEIKLSKSFVTFRWLFS